MNTIERLLALDAGKIEMPTAIHKMYCKKLGGNYEFEIRAIDPEKIGSIQEKAVELKQGDIESVKIYSTKILTILEGCPIFKNKDLLEHFGSPTPKELIKKLLLAGEMDSLKDAIDELSAITKGEDEDMDEEIKN